MKLQNLPILCSHTLDTSTNTNINHSSCDGVGDIDASLQTRRALSVQGFDGSIGRETSNNSSCAELGGTTAGCENIANCDVFDELRVDFGTLE
jgi:hypothetical protein